MAGQSDDSVDVAEDPTSTPTDELTSEQIAARPDVQEAFQATFGSEEASATRRADRSRQEEDADELKGLATDELDDGVESESDEDESLEDDTETQDDADRNEEDAAGSEEEDEKSTLDPLLMHAARRAGLSDEDVSSFHGSDPDIAERMFRRFKEQQDGLSAEYGRLGAQQRTVADRDEAQAVATKPVEGGTSPLERVYGKDKLEALREKFDPELIDEIVGPILAPVAAMMQQQEEINLQAVSREIDSFFSGLDEGLGNLYGQSSDVTDEQFGRRESLGRLAGQIQDGAALSGLNLSTSECLERALGVHAREHLGELERKKVTRQVRKRSESLSHRPTQRRTRRGAPTSPEAADEAAAQAYKDRATEIGFGLND